MNNYFCNQKADSEKKKIKKVVWVDRFMDKVYVTFILIETGRQHFYASGACKHTLKLITWTSKWGSNSGSC